MEDATLPSADVESFESPRPNKHRKPFPNAFVSVRVPSVEVCDKLKEVQEGMLAIDKRARQVLVPLQMLHITLVVLMLETETDIQRARDCLLVAARRATSSLHLDTDSLILDFCGLGTFGGKVVFAELKGGEARERLTAVADIVRSTFEEHGFPSPDRRAFTPHLTVAKTGRQGLSHIDQKLYEEFQHRDVGQQRVSGLELLSMVEPMDCDGYYHCFERCEFACTASTSGEGPTEGAA